MKNELKILKVRLKPDTAPEVLDKLVELRDTVSFYAEFWKNIQSKYKSKNFLLRFFTRKEHKKMMAKLYQLFVDAHNDYVGYFQAVYYEQYGEYFSEFKKIN